MSKIYITISGGLVTEITSTDNRIEVAIIDMDILNDELSIERSLNIETAETLFRIY